MIRKTLSSALLLIAVAVGGCAVSAAPTLKQNPDSTSMSQASYTAFVSNDGKTQISLPTGWQNARKPSTSPKFKIKVADRSRDLHLIVISNKKLPATNLEQMAEVGIMSGKAALQNAQVERTSVKKVGNYAAIQHKIQGRAMGIVDAVMLVTVIETPTQHHVILAQSPSATFAQNKAELEQLIQSFKEVKTAVSSK